MAEKSIGTLSVYLKGNKSGLDRTLKSASKDIGDFKSFATKSIKRRSGVLHNHTCKHFKNRQPEELSPWKDIESFQYRNCRMCKGDKIRQK